MRGKYQGWTSAKLASAQRHDTDSLNDHSDDDNIIDWWLAPLEKTSDCRGKTTIVDVRVGSIAHQEVLPCQCARETERQTTEYVAFLLVDNDTEKPHRVRGLGRRSTSFQQCRSVTVTMTTGICVRCVNIQHEDSGAH